MKDIGNTTIDIYGDLVKIIVNDIIIDNSSLKWRETELGETELTLNEISKQLNVEGVIYVWVEGGLKGKIYQFNNYADGKWYEHGTTKGFA